MRLRAWLFLFFQGVSASAAIALMTLIKRGLIRLWPLIRDDVEALGLAFEVWRMCSQRTVHGSVCQPATIAVIQNSMNLTDIESYTQKVVLGLVILGAVLLDRIRHAR